jgi:hypothetical protein
MKRRRNDFEKYLAPFVESNWKNTEVAMREVFEKHKHQLLATLHEALNACSNKALKAEESGRKRKTAFIVFSFLNTAFLDGSHNLLIEFFDDDYYLDLTECSAGFSYRFLMEEFDTFNQSLIREIEEKFVRCMDYELSAIRWRYKEFLFEKIREFLLLLLSDETTTPIFKAMNLNNKATIMYGYYFNQQVPLFQIV